MMSISVLISRASFLIYVHIIVALGICRCCSRNSWISWKTIPCFEISNSILSMDYLQFQRQEGHRSGCNWCLLSFLQFLSRTPPCRWWAQILVWWYLSECPWTHNLICRTLLPWLQTHPSIRRNLFLIRFGDQALSDMSVTVSKFTDLCFLLLFRPEICLIAQPWRLRGCNRKLKKSEKC